MIQLGPSFWPTRFIPLDGPPQQGTFWRCVRKKWPSWGGDRFVFSVCPWPTSSGPAQKEGGDRIIILFSNRRMYQKAFSPMNCNS